MIFFFALLLYNYSYISFQTFASIMFYYLHNPIRYNTKGQVCPERNLFFLRLATSYYTSRCVCVCVKFFRNFYFPFCESPILVKRVPINHTGLISSPLLSTRPFADGVSPDSVFGDIDHHRIIFQHEVWPCEWQVAQVSCSWSLVGVQLQSSFKCI